MMYNNKKSLKHSGLNSIAKNAIRLDGMIERPNTSELTYHVLATLYIWNAITYPVPSQSLERLKFFYENGYKSNLIVKAGKNETQIFNYAAYFYKTAQSVRVKEEMRRTLGYLDGLKLNKNDNTLLEIVDYEPEKQGAFGYNYGSMLGKCVITPGKDGNYFLNFVK